MRVLAVGNMYPPHHLGGYELVWRSAMEQARGGGHEVRVLTTDFHLGDGIRDEPGVYRQLRWYWRDHDFPRLSPLARLGLERRNRKVFDWHVAEFEPDVVTWWAMGGMSLSLLGRAQRAGLPGVAFVHDDWLLYGPQVDAWMRLTRGRPRTGGIRWLFVSETTRRRALERWPGLEDTEVAHSGIDPAFLVPAPAREWGGRLLYAGRIDPRKGIATAIAALAHLSDVTLTVVGAGDESHLAELRELAAAHTVGERVSFEGPRDRRGLMAAYADHDAVVFPVEWEEPWGLVPLEAMGRGRPVLATGRGGSGEYLRDGENCLLFAPGDPLSLADVARRLASDSALRDRLRTGGFATAPAHTEARFNAAVLSALEQAAGG